MRRKGRRSERADVLGNRDERDGRMFDRMSEQDLDSLYQAAVIDESGDSIGKVAHVYLDNRTERPSWVTVRTGFFGTHETLVPLRGAKLSDGDIHIPYRKAYVKDAPHFDAERRLTEDEEGSFYRYYDDGDEARDDPERDDRDEHRGHDQAPDLKDRQHDESRHDDARHDDARHDDARHDDARHDDARHDDARHRENLRSRGLVRDLDADDSGAQADALREEARLREEVRVYEATGKRHDPYDTDQPHQVPGGAPARGDETRRDDARHDEARHREELRSRGLVRDLDADESGAQADALREEERLREEASAYEAAGKRHDPYSPDQPHQAPGGVPARGDEGRARQHKVDEGVDRDAGPQRVSDVVDAAPEQLDRDNARSGRDSAGSTRDDARVGQGHSRRADERSVLGRLRLRRHDWSEDVTRQTDPRVQDIPEAENDPIVRGDDDPRGI